MYILWIVTMTCNIRISNLGTFNTYFLIAKFCFSQKFLKVIWLLLTVNTFDAVKAWNISLIVFNGILNCVLKTGGLFGLNVEINGKTSSVFFWFLSSFWGIFRAFLITLLYWRGSLGFNSLVELDQQL